ncbi:hypothetical protein FRB99_005360 [Tulasnella sp. 403]|nr:hypothetical protein FRB99_005360 [Tulasnella sp. 403]
MPSFLNDTPFLRLLRGEDVTKSLNPIQLLKNIRDVLESVTRLGPSGKVASLAHGPVTKHFFCFLVYTDLFWHDSPPNSSPRPKTLQGPRNDLADVLRAFGYVHDDPRYVLLTDFDCEYGGADIPAQNTSRAAIVSVNLPLACVTPLTAVHQLERLRNFINSLESDDKAIIYFAGHGVAEMRQPNGPSYQALLATDTEHTSSIIDDRTLQTEIFGNLKPGTALVVVLDACSSENILGLPNSSKTPKKGRFLRWRSNPEHEIILVAAAQAGQRAYSQALVDGEPMHGVLTSVLLDYIGIHQTMDIEALKVHLRDQCSQRTEREEAGRQEPVVSLSNPSIRRLVLSAS